MGETISLLPTWTPSQGLRNFLLTMKLLVEDHLYALGKISALGRAASLGVVPE